MPQAWAICQVCGKVLAVDPVEAPGEPAALTEHRREHAKETGPASSGAPPSGRPHVRREA